MFFHLHIPQVLILHQEVQQSSLMPRVIVQTDCGERAFPSGSPGSKETASRVSQVVLSSVQGQTSEQNLSPCSSQGAPTRIPTCPLPTEVNPGLPAEPKQGSGCEWLLPLPTTSTRGAGTAQGCSHGRQGADPSGSRGAQPDHPLLSTSTQPHPHIQPHSTGTEEPSLPLAK